MHPGTSGAVTSTGVVSGVELTSVDLTSVDTVPSGIPTTGMSVGDPSPPVAS